MNTNTSKKDRGLCTTCGSYVLAVPQCDAGAGGEWGACCMFEKTVKWDEECNHWWEWIVGPIWKDKEQGEKG